MNTARRVNLRDIAEAAGVSMQTASRVVRGVDVVAEPTRERVLEVVRRLNYRPNLAARSLSGRRTGSINVIVTVPLLHGHTTAFVAICEALAELHLNASVRFIRPGEDPRPTGSDLMPLGADGAVVIGGYASPIEWLDQLSQRMPVVYVGKSETLPEAVASARIGQSRGARLATEHLIDRGATALAHVAGPRDWMDAEARRDGFERICVERGVPHHIIPARTWDAAEARRLASDLPDDVDGIFAANDSLALGIMSSLHQAGRRVPEDVRVVGFDDAEGSESFHPALTTVRQDFARLGAVAVQQLESLLAGQPPQSEVVDTELIIRESC